MRKARCLGTFLKSSAMMNLMTSADIDYDKTDQKMASWYSI